MRLSTLFVLPLALLLTVGCDVTAGDGDGGGLSGSMSDNYSDSQSYIGPGSTSPSSSTASDFEVDGCKARCETQKLHGCYDSQQLADCFADCSIATSDQIELFAACVDTSICDASCTIHLQGTSLEPSGGSSGGGSSDAGGGAPIEDSIEDLCKETCTFLQMTDCLTISEEIACRQGCGIVSDAKAEEFNTCVSELGCDLACFEDYLPSLGAEEDEDDSAGGGSSGGFSGDGASLGCFDACDQLMFVDCISGAEHSQCYDACDVVDAGDAQWFQSCAFADICDVECYWVLLEKAEGE